MAALGVVAALVAGTAEARSFLMLRAPADAWMIIDPASIEAVPGSTVRRMWIVTVQRNLLNETPPQPGYVRALNEYDCEAQTTRWKSFTAFSRSGSPLITRENADPAWMAVTPASGLLGEWRVACGQSAGDSAISADSVAKVVIALMRAWDPLLPPASATAAAKAAPPTAALKPPGSPKPLPRKPGPAAPNR